MKSKAKVKRQKAKGNAAISRAAIFLLPFYFCLLPSLVKAAPTQEEVLQSINDSVGHTVDESSVIGFVIAVVAIVLVLVLFSFRRQNTFKPKQLNNPGKLLKEVSTSINLKPAEVRQLKLLAEGMEISSPLVLLMCPSLMAKAVTENSHRIDRRVVSVLAKKIMQNRTSTAAQKKAA